HPKYPTLQTRGMINYRNKSELHIMSNFSCYTIWVHKLSKYTIRFMIFSCYTIWVQQRPVRQTLPSGHGRKCHQGYRRHVSRSLCIHKPSSPDIDARPPLCSTLAMTVHLHARL